MKVYLWVAVLFLFSCSGGSDDPQPKVTVDTTPPLLVLNGEDIVSIQQGETFNDAGVMANDDVDGDISSAVLIEGEVNTDSLGKYVLTYKVSDVAGNAAVALTRTVLVKNDSLFLQVDIDTHGVTIVDEPKILASMQMMSANEMIYDGNIGIEIRGSSSQSFDKKSYGFETWDSDGNDMNFALGNFPEEEDWIFYGPFSDKSLLRNVLIYQLSNEMGRYATRTEFSEVTINGEYRGVYVLMEKMKRDKNRVDVSKLKDDDITGGYIIKIDKTTGEAAGTDFSFSSLYDGFGESSGTQKIQFLYEYPDAEDLSDQQKAYIQGYYHGFEQALKSNQFTDATNGYQKYIDVPSFIDFFILNELSHNVDGFRISTFMHKDKGEKLKMGPIWDFNLAFGNADYCRGETTDDWAYKFNEYCPNDLSRVPFWWSRLLEDPAFVAALQARWTELRGNVLSDTKVQSKIAAHSANLIYSNAVQRNFETFDVLGSYLWPNFFVGDTYEEEVDYLDDWVLQRMQWMDTAIANL